MRFDYLKVFIFACCLLTALPIQARAQTFDSPIPERRLLVERDTDFYGDDLRSLFDTTFEACQQACLTDPNCQAFTFNSRSNSCFAKRAVTKREPYTGAISAIVVKTPTATLETAKLRSAQLDFMRPEDLVAARKEAEAIAMRHFTSGWSPQALISGMEEARVAGDHNAALKWSGSYTAMTDAPDGWLAYAESALQAKINDRNRQNELRQRAIPAAVNAYLRAATPQMQAEALLVLARALEDSKREREILPALRLADRTAPSGAVSTALNEAISLYGFQIVDHRVDSDPARPRICAIFNEPLARGMDFEPYVQLPETGFSVEAEDRELCVEGVQHGARYQLTFRAGTPAESGEGLIKDVDLNVYVRDRSPSVRFPGRAYVLARTPDAALPIVTVNLDEVELALHRVDDRNLMQMIQQNMFGEQLSPWETDRLEGKMAEEIWRGTGEVDRALNQDVTTLLPMAEAIGDQPAGLYALQASVAGMDSYDAPTATQWFVISDLGLASMSGADGLHLFVRSLGTADPLEGIDVSLISRSNRVLASVATDADGHAAFELGLVNGRGGSAPALVLARKGEEDLGFLSLSDPEFDLSDRGVEGRQAAGPVDLFLATDRGAYRAGETIHATVLARDGKAQAIAGLPVTAILSRPDGVEYSRHVTDGGTAGGHVVSMPLGGTVPRGTWKIALHTDPDAPALSTRELLVEDFLPERIDFKMVLPEGALDSTSKPPLAVNAQYLFGASGSDLPVEGEVRLSATDMIEGFPGYSFGRYDDPFEPHMAALEATRTGANGVAILRVAFPDIPETTRPLEAQVSVRVSEGSGRPVERQMTRPVAPTGPLIGLRPLFDGVVGEGSEAGFEVIGIGADLSAMPMRVSWKLNRIETRYQWYSAYGSWNWEPMTRRSRVASGEASLEGAPLQISAPVDWGQYELVVERVDGSYAAAAYAFDAGWYAPAEALSTPDLLDVSLDREAYRAGDAARLRVVPRHAGKALITVASNRLIDMKTVELPAGESLIELPVTDDWGAGAYVTATLIRPMNAPTEGHAPARALGLAHASVDPGAARLSASFEVPEKAEPREALEVVLRVEGMTEGETAFATIAAVDQGILNLTGHLPPDAPGYYFGQRKLGVGMRDIYGRLIDGQSGNRGSLRSGGDAEAQMRMQAPPPTEELVAYFSGLLTVGPDGTARTSFDMPSFNGQVKLMAVVWSNSGVGKADADVLVRDPAVLTASLPRIMAPGDSTEMRLELVHAEGPVGAFGIEAMAEGVTLDASAIPAALELGEGEKTVLSVPVMATETGLAEIVLAVTTPGGKRLEKTLKLPVQVNDPETATTTRFPLAAGASFTLSRDVFTGMRPGTGSATLALGPLGRLDAPGLLSALDRYPYGCTEQVTSQALPLLYFDQLASAMGMEENATIPERIGQAIDIVLSRQTSSGGFGLWNAYDSDMWLDAYVSDFLSRARAQGHSVPDLAFRQAMDNLRNELNYAGDFQTGGEDVAYALLVLAREGAAPIGDLRYYADVKGDDFGSPLATAQIGSALAMYGDQPRADAMFRRAAAQLLPKLSDEQEAIWRADYGTNLRDSAAVLTLAVEAGSEAFDRNVLVDRLADTDRSRSTQESVWSLLAAHALVETSAGDFLIDGDPVDGPLVRVMEDETSAVPIIVTNTGAQEAQLTLTTFGVPLQPESRNGNGYSIDRAYYTMEGEPADPGLVQQGTRLVAVLTVKPFQQSEARLMVNDPLPAGFEIDNPSLVRSGDIRGLDWLQTAEARNTEFRQERFLAAVDWRSDKPLRLAYILRAVSPGSYHHPAASVEDMYRPQFRARGEEGRVTVTE
ncbi:alpha-2-macroglobulin family protein [Aliiruegeria sabulilitoris]|uniref:alpha-2-macroglobulin family protein n=1 Tax=Aliiruegeria sabulilitoris TaxID=1510458 RepID=UPI0008367D89|nr:alpha-2-macroglobulin family protein [Aliiruegeria sabulilitoris]NDR57659.1 alpha-2-macroglobulin family protein [Pseudoruegeria sp. M32A2M]